MTQIRLVTLGTRDKLETGGLWVAFAGSIMICVNSPP